MFCFFVLLGVYLQDSVKKAKSVRKGFWALFLKLQSWRGKKTLFSTYVRTLEGTFEILSLF